MEQEYVISFAFDGNPIPKPPEARPAGPDRWRVHVFAYSLEEAMDEFGEAMQGYKLLDVEVAERGD